MRGFPCIDAIDKQDLSFLVDGLALTLFLKQIRAFRDLPIASAENVRNVYHMFKLLFLLRKKNM